MRRYPLGATMGYTAEALLFGAGDREQALAYAVKHAGRMPGAAAVLKAATAPDGLQDWAAQPEGMTEFMEAVTESSLLRIAGLVSAPINTPLIEVASNGSANWVGEKNTKGATAPAFKALDRLTPTKCAGLAVFTKELQRGAVPGSNGVISRALTTATSDAIDAAFSDPNNAGIVGVKPAGVAYGAPVIASTGDVAADVATGLASITGPREAVLVGNTLDAAMLAAQRDANGAPLYPDMGPLGGQLAGVQLYTSDTAPRGQLVLFNPTRTFVWSGGVRLSYTESAVVRLDTSPATDGVMTSLWQLDLVGLLIEQFASWEPAPNSAAVVMLA